MNQRVLAFTCNVTAWVTTARFLEVFALGSLRDLPDLDALDDTGVSEREDSVETALDDALGLEDEESEQDDGVFDELGLEAWSASFRLC